MILFPPSLDAIIAGRPLTRVDVGESGGDVLRVGDNAYLKHGSGLVAQDIADEYARLTWLRGRIAVPRVLYFAAFEEASWLLTEAVPGQSAEDLLDDPRTRSSTISALAAFLHSFHALPAAECPFEAGHELRMIDARRNIDAGRVDESDFDDNHRGWSAERIWKSLQQALPLPFQRVVTHGDFSTANIFLEAGEVTGCIDVGRAGVADPYQDLAILWNNLGDQGPEAQAELLASYGATEPDLARLRFHLDLDELF